MPEASSNTRTTRRKAVSFRRPNSLRPVHVPKATAGNPIRKRLNVPGAIIPVPPRNSAVNRNTITPHRLEHGALLGRRPSAQCAPDGEDNAGETGRPAEHSVQHADHAISEAPGLARGWKPRTDQAVKAKGDEHDTDAEPQSARRGPAQDLGAERHADHRADQEGRKPGWTDRVPQFPHRPALHDQPEGSDENGGLCRRQEVEPCRRCDNRKRETGEPGDRGSRKSG